MGKDETCKHLGDKKVEEGTVEWARHLVREGYIVEWWASPLSAARVEIADEVLQDRGQPSGCDVMGVV